MFDLISENFSYAPCTVDVPKINAHRCWEIEYESILKVHTKNIFKKVIFFGSSKVYYIGKFPVTILILILE